MEPSFRVLLPLTAFVTLGACSILNAPGKEVPGSGGAGGGCDCASLDDACNTGVCKDGKCVAVPKMNGTHCDDGDFCTDDDSCHEGKCIGGNPHVCKDKDACHPGTCDKASQKCTTSVLPDNSPCDDGNPCDAMGACMSGKCQNGMSKCGMPPYTTYCGQGYCEQGKGCKTMSNPMHDADPCTDGIAPECATGTCVAGMCAPTMIMGTDGTACDSGKFCLVGTSCQMGSCTGGAKRVCDSPDVCQKAECDDAQNICNVSDLPDGMDCDDGTGCNMGTTCHGGTCGHPTKTITKCGPTDHCCPTSGSCTAAMDSDCFYWKSGVQLNVDDSKLLGWTQCFVDTFSPDNTTDLITALVTDCELGSKLLVGCRQAGSSTIQMLAMANWTDVTDECQWATDFSQTTFSGDPCIHTANGVQWYFNEGQDFANSGGATESIFGFAPVGDDVQVDGFDCDYNQQQDGNKRFCTYTYNTYFDYGQRCGSVFYPYDAYERVFYYAP